MITILRMLRASFFLLDNNFLFYIFSHFESDSKKGGKEDEVLRSKFRRKTQRTV